MNFEKFINSDYLKENPLCGIDTHKDELNLSTGACSRQIKKFVLTGKEYWTLQSINSYGIANLWTRLPVDFISHRLGLSSHLSVQTTPIANTETEGFYLTSRNVLYIRIDATRASTAADFKAYLATQYANETPVTVWYISATPTTETITVPSGLSGTVEGYLNQSGTPTPTNPIYPTANTVEQWFDLNHYIMGTSTDTITTLPADIYANDTTATVGLKGQTLQSSTSSPTSPVLPGGCGERTENLFDEKYPSISPTIQYMSIFVGDGTFTLSSTTPQMPNGAACLFLIAGDVSSGAGPQNKVYNEQSITVDSTNGYITIAYRIVADYDPRNYTTMLNTGSTPLPYEPYGYKIPISSANTTTHVYLGEVETTRTIKKIVFVGSEDENWEGQSAGGAFRFRYTLSNSVQADTAHLTSICTHLPLGVEGGTWNTDDVYTISSDYLWLRLDSNFTTVAALKSWLAQQYANGTPFTVYYTLANPETAVVNEPLMKIGDYADEVSNVSIPVTAGGGTLSVDTTVQPSEVTVNYKGWHPVQSVHEKSKNLFDKSS